MNGFGRAGCWATAPLIPTRFSFMRLMDIVSLEALFDTNNYYSLVSMASFAFISSGPAGGGGCLPPPPLSPVAAGRQCRPRLTATTAGRARGATALRPLLAVGQLARVGLERSIRAGLYACVCAWGAAERQSVMKEKRPTSCLQVSPHFSLFLAAPPLLTPRERHSTLARAYRSPGVCAVTLPSPHAFLPSLAP